MEHPDVEDLRVRWDLVRPFALIGIPCVVAGGLVAAVTGPMGLEKGSWAAAYLVLVAGVAQIALAAGQAWLPTRPPTTRWTMWEFGTWNGGNAVVLAATFTGVQLLVAVGGVALLAALVLFAGRTNKPRARARGWLATYRVGVGALILSVPVGVMVSVVRHG